MLKLQKDPLDLQEYFKSINASIGACLFFAGIVRNAPEDQQVQGIEYHAYDKLCFHKEKHFEQNFKSLFPDKSYHIVHRLGYLPVKETSLIVTLFSPHRNKSFSSLEFIVEWIKSDLPVWKKIIHCDGSSHWKANF